MARRTKEVAEATRNKLLDAAQDVFYRKGVAGATLADVAVVAGVTRGAVYWHFENKVDLFNALMRRTTLPFAQALEVGGLASGAGGSALDALLDVFRLVLRSVSNDEATRRVFDIAIHKTECVGELFAVRQGRMQEAQLFTVQMEHMLSKAAKQQQLELPISTISASHGLHAVFCGVLHAWLLHPEPPFDLESEGVVVIAMYLRGLGFRLDF